MPPRPLNNLTSARAHPGDNHNLTPRTPHSRAGRAEEAFTEIELEQFGDDEYKTYTVSQQQREPLLASSASDSFPPSGLRARGDDDAHVDSTPRPLRVLKWMVANLGLVLGSVVALVLLLLIIVSYRRPEALLKVIGELNVTSTSSPVPSSPKQEALASADTISYANHTRFPLDPMEYKQECHKMTGDFMRPMPYWSGTMDVLHHDQVEPGNYPVPEGERTHVCSKTITYMLDGHVGLLADLALMAQVAGLAKERNRTFLVDDTYWNRGKWTDHFQDVRFRQPGPEPGCRAPPPEELVACPRTARHWVVNSRTAKYHFGHGFHTEYDDPYAHYLNRFKPIFTRARESMTKTIRPNAANAALIHAARTEFTSLLPPGPSRHASLPVPTGGSLATDPGRYVGVHIRHGDRMAASWKFHDQHLPMDEYSTATTSTWSRLFKTTPSPIVYIASDDPTAHEQLVPLLPSGSTTYSLGRSKSPDLRVLASPKEYVQAEFAKLDLAERIRQTRGMVVDFALLSGLWAWNDEIQPGAVVCTISSNICKLSAVGLDWNRAFGHGFANNANGEIDRTHMRWVEIDEKGVVEPAWAAFEIFQ